MTRRPAEAPTDSLPIDAIKVGKRFRQSLGDIDSLARSIAEHGLLHPIVVTPERDLVAGERRLAAVRQLGWTEVPVRIVTPADLLGAESDENGIREPFTPSEAIAMGEALRPAVEAAARARMAAGGKGGQIAHPSRVRETLAAAVGMKPRTYEKAAAIQKAVEADPELAPLAELMDSGSVDAAFRKLPKPERAPDLALTDVHAGKFPELAAADLRVQLTQALYAFGKPGAFEPEEWTERVARLRPEDVALVRQHLAYVRRWLEKWDRLLVRPALSLVEGSPE